MKALQPQNTGIMKKMGNTLTNTNSVILGDAND